MPDSQNQPDLFSEVKTPSAAQIIADQIFTVSQAAELINDILQPLLLTIEGEVSGFKVSQNKWVFFDIKDETATLNCFMVLYQLPFALEDGMKIRVQAQPKLRVNTGKLSLTVKSMELLGEGALQKAFEELQHKLDKEGLFDQKWKKPLPFFPKNIGIITSKTGDALQDIVRILQNRSGGLTLTLAPVAVQGQDAVRSIVRALTYFNTHHPVDVLIVARGGGSLEDLQAFNAEPVVRAIFASKIPVITGVGHEPDVTLVDLVADARAATPSNVAEIVVPNYDQLQTELFHTTERIRAGVKNVVLRRSEALDSLVHRLRHALQRPFQRVELLRDRMLMQLKKTERTFWHQREQVIHMHQLLVHTQKVFIEQLRQDLELTGASLQGLDPTQILKRGYAIVTTYDGSVIKSVRDVVKDDTLRVRVSNGSFNARAIE